MAVIAAILMVKEGGGAEALPSQFAPVSVGLVSASKLATEAVPARHAVAWMPRQRQIKHVVMLVGESLRADYIDWTPGNPYTPDLARLRPRLVDFGPAVSGGNCSHYSNAILRFDATPDQLGSFARPDQSDAVAIRQARRLSHRLYRRPVRLQSQPGKLQNFMTAKETADIDSLVTMPETAPTPTLDDRLLDTVIKELRSPKPVFIYANKNGAHFPYDNAYPKSQRLFRPTMTEAMYAAAGGDVSKHTLTSNMAGGPSQTRINSYRNAVRWSVDRFFGRLFKEADLDDTVIIFTSDHGQQFDPAHLTHCTVEDPDAREGYVPLFVSTTNPDLRARFAAGAEASRWHASHFQIAPTLFALFGYRKSDIDSRYGPSLFEANTRAPAFTSGDIFGLFSEQVRWHPLDLKKNYLEPGATAVPPVKNFTEAVPANAGTQTR